MSEEKKDSCGCGCDCDCKSKANRLLNNFFFVVIIILLSGIFYTMQGMVSMCQMRDKALCPLKVKGGMPCPLMDKGSLQTEK